MCTVSFLAIPIRRRHCGNINNAARLMYNRLATRYHSPTLTAQLTAASAPKPIQYYSGYTVVWPLIFRVSDNRDIKFFASVSVVFKVLFLKFTCPGICDRCSGHRGRWCFRVLARCVSVGGLFCSDGVVWSTGVGGEAKSLPPRRRRVYIIITYVYHVHTYIVLRVSVPSEFHRRQMFFFGSTGPPSCGHDGKTLCLPLRWRVVGRESRALVVGGGRRCRVRSRSAIVLRKNPTGTDLFHFGRCRYAVGFTCSFF